jgi:hypothetical protein
MIRSWPARMLGAIVALAPVPYATGAADGHAPEPPATPPTTPAPADAPPTTPPETDAPKPAGPVIVDSVLPCGVRVIVAQDETLPVAAVVLAVETGTEDDPTDAPGLVHALAYHLLQGNREYAPNGIARAVHANGGVTSLAIGPAQVRFESLVPVSMLGEMVVAEASRLRAPTVSATLWKDSLRNARRDRARAWGVPAPLRASAHGSEGLAHDGHVVGDALEAMSERAVGSQLAERFTYDRSTLVVVTPEAPEVALLSVFPAFADLPPTPRRARDRSPAPQAGSVPRTIPLQGHGGTFVWALPADTPGQAWAEVVCGTLNRLKRTASESTRARVRCAIDDDPRRGVMIVKASGADDLQILVRDRLQRVRDDEGGHFGKERAAVLERLRQQLGSPLPLARHLARVKQPGPASGADAIAPVADMLGSAALEIEAGVPPAYRHLLELGASTLAIDTAKKPASPP